MLPIYDVTQLERVCGGSPPQAPPRADGAPRAGGFAIEGGRLLDLLCDLLLKGVPLFLLLFPLFFREEAPKLLHSTQPMLF